MSDENSVTREMAAAGAAELEKVLDSPKMSMGDAVIMIYRAMRALEPPLQIVVHPPKAYRLEFREGLRSPVWQEESNED